jgi:hypothetical protein
MKAALSGGNSSSGEASPACLAFGFNRHDVANLASWGLPNPVCNPDADLFLIQIGEKS